MGKAKKPKEPTISIPFTFTDLSILVWGVQGVTWAEKENEEEWDAAVEKIGAAYMKLGGFGHSEGEQNADQ